MDLLKNKFVIGAIIAIVAALFIKPDIIPFLDVETNVSEDAQNRIDSLLYANKEFSERLDEAYENLDYADSIYAVLSNRLSYYEGVNNTHKNTIKDLKNDLKKIQNEKNYILNRPNYDGDSLLVKFAKLIDGITVID